MGALTKSAKIFIVILIAAISILDIFANALSLIPYVGGIFETITEVGFEILQIILATILVLLDS